MKKLAAILAIIAGVVIYHKWFNHTSSESIVEAGVCNTCGSSIYRYVDADDPTTTTSWLNKDNNPLCINRNSHQLNTA